MNYFKDHPSDLVCVGPEKQPIFNNFPNHAWILNCVTKVRIDYFSPKNFQGNGSVTLFIQKCSKFYPNITKIDYSKSQLHNCTTGQDNESFSSELVAAFQKKSTWLISGIFSLILALFATLIVSCCKRCKKSPEERQDTVINPLYGMSQAQDYGYYMEDRIEETNPQYDAYYKDYTSNITNDNENYGNDDNDS